MRAAAGAPAFVGCTSGLGRRFLKPNGSISSDRPAKHRRERKPHQDADGQQSLPCSQRRIFIHSLEHC